jgi:hypothetical protein
VCLLQLMVLLEVGEGEAGVADGGEGKDVRLEVDEELDRVWDVGRLVEGPVKSAHEGDVLSEQEEVIRCQLRA